jgi:hypothetical protein
MVRVGNLDFFKTRHYHVKWSRAARTAQDHQFMAYRCNAMHHLTVSALRGRVGNRSLPRLLRP